uniref:NECAP endocytosis associated 2 n=1 Tax=Bos indicus x Bos taurus TaxID=30522 RepID=A0A4W2GYJ8_BOBOX
MEIVWSFSQDVCQPRSRAHSPRALPIPIPTPNMEKGSRSLSQQHNGFCPFRAAEWQLDQPSWSGRLRITAKGQVAYIKLEDRTSGELFAQAPVDQFPGTAVESVTDSSRYFVIRIEDGNGRRAFIGIGFGDRGDAFDFNVALQDHFKWVKQQCEFAKQAQNPDQGPKLDLSFKEGQTIKLNIALVNCLLRENPGHVPWTGWDVSLCLIGKKLTFKEHQPCARA